MDKFIARYEKDGVKKSIAFNKTQFDRVKAEQYLNDNGIQNFFFFWDPYEPIKINENTFLFRGDVGFDITTEKLIPYLQAGNEIVFDSFGGDLWEGLKIYDIIKGMGTNPSIGVLGSCASSITLPLCATSNSWMTPNSRFLVHNPWTWEAGDDTQLRKTADELEAEKLNIANIYTAVTGISQEEILSLMKEERFMSASETLDKKFINRINTNFNLKDDDMNNKEVEQKLSTLETMMNKVINMFGSNSPKNIVIQDVNGVEIDFGEDIETADQIAIGNTATVDGQPAEGDYTIEDGTMYTFTGGELTAIKEPEGAEDDVEALKAENADLKQQLSDVQNKLTTVETERNTHKANLETVKADMMSIKNEFDGFKSKFTNDPVTTNAPTQNSGEGNRTKFSYKK